MKLKEPLKHINTKITGQVFHYWQNNRLSLFHQGLAVNSEVTERVGLVLIASHTLMAEKVK